MTNYLFFRNDGGSDAANDAAMLPAEACAGLLLSAASGATSVAKVYFDPRDNAFLLTGADANTAYNDDVALTYPSTHSFFEIASACVERINARGPFTVMVDLEQDLGDANTPSKGTAEIHQVTAVAITSAD